MGAAAAGAPARSYGLPPGQEELIAAMLGRGAALPGGCRWEGASIDGDRVSARYRCDGGEATLTLLHARAAAAGALRLGNTALVPGPGAPTELVRAVAGRVGEREAQLRWMTVGAQPRSANALRHAAGVAVAGAVGLAAALALLLLARSAARALRPRLPRVLLRRPRLSAPLAAAAAVASGHAALRALGLVLVASVGRVPWPVLGAAAGLALLGLYGGIAAAAVLRAAASRGPAALLLAGAAAIDLGLLFPATLPPPPERGFGGLVLPDREPTVERSRLRPAVTYRYDRHGFREPGFSEAPAPGAYRVALVGDSYVFGSGVPLEGTLAVQLAGALAARDPARKVEVLNLGVPGANLASDVDLALAAAGRLAPDAVVLCLVVPNDLSRWDVQERYRQASRPGPFALASWLLGGDGAAFAWDLLFLEREVTPAGLAHLRRQLDRLAVLRGRTSPRLLFFGYSTDDAEVDAVVHERTGAVVVRPPATRAEDFIPGDGHPTAAGNRAFAALLAAALDAPPATP